jgi:hypothetical protein
VLVEQGSTSRGIWIREPSQSRKDDDAYSDISDLSSCYLPSASRSEPFLGVNEQLSSLQAIVPGQLLYVPQTSDSSLPLPSHVYSL